VGGNGQQVTFRYAARYADELNLVFLEPDEIRAALPVARQRCEEEGRDPSTLRISLYCRDNDVRADGQARVDRLGGYAELGHERRRARVVREGCPGGRAAARDGADGGRQRVIGRAARG
jgi:alkanesulfonate monooxygenase SsuD/methylene tetrahydromethanopterin reductase-like flavin-dependent oxidoreductase (luciferase family)